jgi:hypothetical protein
MNIQMMFLLLFISIIKLFYLNVPIVVQSTISQTIETNTVKAIWLISSFKDNLRHLGNIQSAK